jgi:LysR family transcriptional regulator, cell division regulator
MVLDTVGLKAFRTVAELGNVTRAAENLHTVQSNVTSRIQQLEARLGTTLFVRHNRGVRLTRAGELLLTYAQRIERLVDEAAKVVSESSGGGDLHIGAVETVIAVRLAAPIAEFRKKYPKVNLSVSTGTTDQLVRDVMEAKLDGAFVCGPVVHKDLVSDAVCEEELGLVSARDNGDAGSADQAVLVMRHGCGYRARTEAWFRKTGRAPIRLMELATLDGLVGLVAAGVGVTLLPRSVAMRQQYTSLLNFQQLSWPELRVPTQFVRRKESAQPQHLESLLDAVRSSVIKSDAGRDRVRRLSLRVMRAK